MNSPNAVPIGSFGPIDTAVSVEQCLGVEKKSHKAEEPKATYATKKPAVAESAQTATGPRFAALEKVRMANAKLIQVHSKVLRKLAQ